MADEPLTPGQHRARHEGPHRLLDDGRPRYAWALLALFVAAFLGGLLLGHMVGAQGVKAEALRAGAGYVDADGSFRWARRGRP